MAGGLFLVVFDLNGFKIFGLKDLTAIQTLDIVDAVPAGDDLGAGMITGGLHIPTL